MFTYYYSIQEFEAFSADSLQYASYLKVRLLSMAGGGAACMHTSIKFFDAGVSMKLAVACAPVRRVQRNNEYNARDYEV